MIHLQNLLIWNAAYNGAKRSKDAFADPLEGPEWQSIAPRKPFSFFPF